MAADFTVPVTTIVNVESHPDAHSLDLVTVYGYQVITQKGRFSPGDLCVYIPVDSILPKQLEEKLFANSKVSLSKSRVRASRIRGVVSFGMVTQLDVLPAGTNVVPENDYAGVLGITKYEPPPPRFASAVTTKLRNKPDENAYFHKYGGLDNLRRFPRLIPDATLVVITEKMHGTNFRAGWLPRAPKSWWCKIKKFFGLLSKYQYCWGSNNVQLQHKKSYAGWYSEDIYTKVSRQYNLETVLPKGYTVYGEIIGPGIQAGYHYGVPEGEHRLLVFDIKRTELVEGKHRSYFLSFDEVISLCAEWGLPVVPELARAPYSLETAQSYVDGPSAYDQSQPVREGVVVRSLNEILINKQRLVLKLINPAYLLDPKNTDNH